jgi:hypothetical protein
MQLASASAPDDSGKVCTDHDLVVKWQDGGRRRKVAISLGIAGRSLATALAKALRRASNLDL